MSSEIPFDPFTTEGLLAFPAFEQEFPQPWHGFQIDTSYKPGLLKLADPVHIRLDSLRANHLELSLDDVPLPDIESLPSSSTTPSEKQNETNVEPQPTIVENDDVWEHLDVQKPKQEVKLISWDSFFESRDEPTKSVYLSEAGFQTFDALLRKIEGQDDSENQIRYAKPDVLLRALQDVALGRESVFFTWYSTSSNFVEMESGYTLSGVSQGSLEQITHRFLDQGKKYHLLANFHFTKACRGPLPNAFASVVREILNDIEQFVSNTQSNSLTLLRLLDIFEKPFAVIDLLFRSMEALQNMVDANEVIGEFLKSIQNESIGYILQLESVVKRLVNRTLQPSLDAVGALIGLAEAETETETPRHEKLSTAILKILPAGTARLLESTSDTLHLLQTAAPEKLSVLRSLSHAKFEFCLSWDDVGQQQEQAEKYEQGSVQVLTSEQAQDNELDTYVHLVRPIHSVIDGCWGEDAFNFEIDLFNPRTSAQRSLLHSDDRESAGTTYLTLISADPPPCLTQLPLLQALQHSMLPKLRVQHRLLSYVAYRSAFQDNNLLLHYQSLYRFHLMNDGIFTSRLSLALFSSDQATGDSKQHASLGYGLGLQSRDTWPPASSELRLVLMGILSESMSDVRDERVTEATSFAIRDLADEELERCRDVNSIHALDFLCLRYKPPSPILENLITAKALKQYDRIFMSSLRLLRVKDLTQYLLRRTCARHRSRSQSPTEQKLRRDMHHFTTALANYSHTIAISTQWHKFEGKMQRLQQCLNNEDYNGVLDLAGSLQNVREMHEQTLNDISHALLLRKKQKPARAVIEDIFGIILRYAALDAATHKEDSDHHDNSMRIREVTTLQQEFNGKVKNLIIYLRSVSSQQSATGNDSEMAAQLLIALDYAGYYQKYNNR